MLSGPWQEANANVAVQHSFYERLLSGILQLSIFILQLSIQATISRFIIVTPIKQTLIICTNE
jgi:hypothetical protein